MICRYCEKEIVDGSIFCSFCGERLARKKKGKKELVKVPKPRQLKSGAWNIELRKEGVSITEATAEECVERARAVRAGYLKIEKAPPEVLLTDAITKYIESRTGIVSPATIATYEKKQTLYFQDLMQKNIFTITEDDVQGEIVKMLTAGGTAGKPLAAKTVKDTVRFITAAMEQSGKSLDLSKLTLPQVQASPYSVLTPDEIRKLLEALPGNPCELQILLALWLGLRRSEIMALEKSDFDLEHKTVTISKAVVRDAAGDWVLKGTKTAKSARVIACPDRIIELVKKQEDGRLYTFDSNYILKCLHRICQQHQLPEIRLHDLRHINASIGLMLGVSDKYMMERGGWSAKDTMVYRYEHTYDAEKSKADRMMNNYFEGLLNPKKKKSRGKNTNGFTNKAKEAP